MIRNQDSNLLKNMQILISLIHTIIIQWQYLDRVGRRNVIWDNSTMFHWIIRVSKAFKLRRDSTFLHIQDIPVGNIGFATLKWIDIEAAKIRV